jgi:hypothetical protein
MNNSALEQKKLQRMKVRLQRKTRELERATDKMPAGRREHLEAQVQGLEGRINGK